MEDIEKLKRDIIFDFRHNERSYEIHSTWGLFSPRHVDEGTELLLKNISVKEDDDILDLGCGYGVMGLILAAQSPYGQTHLVDKDFVAISYVRKNAAINKIRNVTPYLSNAFSQVPPEIRFDTIVANLPAKTGKEMLAIILADAKGHLKPGGKLYVVIVAGLKEFIKRNFKEVFGNYEKVAQGKNYIVAMASV